jgi:hypothetical protein
MTEEAEKATKWDMLVKLKSERSRLAALRDEAREIGQELSTFGSLLANPSWLFTVTQDAIEGVPTAAGGGLNGVKIALSNLSAGRRRICALLNDINETRAKMETLGKATQEIL